MNDITENRRVSPADCRGLLNDIFQHHGATPAVAKSVAAALVAAEIDGQSGHGLSRVRAYVAHLDAGKVDGKASPRVIAQTAAAVHIDAGHGFAYPALDLAIEKLRRMAAGDADADAPTSTAIAAAAVTRSHHFGQAGRHVEQLAQSGLIGLMCGNAPKAIAPWGGNTALFGTNPLAFAAPRRGQPPLVIDMSLSRVARGKVMLARQQGKPIPPDWALDKDGKPTTDAAAALAGTMLPMGEAKGAALALMVEILAAALSGARFSHEASSFFDAQGGPPGVGQFILAINPAFFAADFDARLEALLSLIESQDGVRLPGAARLGLRRRNTVVTLPESWDDLSPG